jgi:squalene cyclase
MQREVPSPLDLHAERSAARAKQYIFSRRSGDQWSDFLTRAGESDEWVTAFVVMHLLSGGVHARALRGCGAVLIARQRSSGGWGYNASFPEDADSTSWCTRAVQATVPEAAREVSAAGNYLLGHQRSGAFSTYRDTDILRSCLGLHSRESVSGWCEVPHACVTASAASALSAAAADSSHPAHLRCRAALELALGSLGDMQLTDGSWTSYWWRTPMYPTAVAIEVLAELGSDSDRARVSAGLEWIARGQRHEGAWDNGDDEGGAFATGLALRILATARRYPDACRRAAEWLYLHQRADGAWDARPILQIPPPWVTDPSSVSCWKRGGLGAPVYVADQNRLFTTSVVYAALRTHARNETSSDHPSRRRCYA